MMLKVRLTVETLSALHIGSTRTGEFDSLFRRLANGNLVVPGTGIAGALRAHLTRVAPAMTGLNAKVYCDALKKIEPQQACGCVICGLMGDIYPDGTDGTATASRLIVDDAEIHHVTTHIRDGVGIDRLSGAAAREDRTKFDLETVPAGTSFTIEMEIERATDLDRELLALLLDEWQSGRLRFGGRSSRGLGAIALREIEVWELDPLHQLDDLMALLREEDWTQTAPKTQLPHPQRRYHAGYEQTEGSTQSWIEITFELQATGLFLTNDVSMADELGFGHVSMPLLPGSGFRGVLRSQAERIARTITNLDSHEEAEFLARCPAAYPTALATDKGDAPDMEAGVSRLKWSQHDSLRPEDRLDPPLELLDLAERLFGNTLYGSRLVVDDLPLREGEGPVCKPLDFLAIDRFTGGGADRLKFDALALWKPCFVGRLYLESPQPWEIGWLLYTLKDMIDGRVPVGFGAAKGFGNVEFHNIAITLGRAYEEALPVPPPDVGWSDTFFEQAMIQGWQNIPVTWFEEWGKAWRNEVLNFVVDERVAHVAGTDYYWRTVEGKPAIHWLYAKEINLDTLYT